MKLGTTLRALPLVLALALPGCKSDCEKYVELACGNGAWKHHDLALGPEVKRYRNEQSCEAAQLGRCISARGKAE